MTTSPTLVAGRYRLIDTLGVGGMGRVWHAWDQTLGRDVAIKEIVPPQALLATERDELRRRTLREARAAARLNHPNVVRVYDVFETNGRPWIVMEFVQAKSLHDVLVADGPVDPSRAAAIGLGVLGALRAAHRAGVMHRDVKPSNVLLSDDGRVVLTDFGIATLEGDPGVTRPGLVLGSPAYISPERARDGTAGPESDLWSLGATLYAAVEGKAPFERNSAIATLTALASEEVEPPRNAGALRWVLNGLLRKDPEARIDAAEAERRLRRAATTGPAAVARKFRWPWTKAADTDFHPPRQAGPEGSIPGGPVPGGPVAGRPVSGGPVAGRPVSGGPGAGGSGAGGGSGAVARGRASAGPIAAGSVPGGFRSDGPRSDGARSGGVRPGQNRADTPHAGGGRSEGARSSHRSDGARSGTRPRGSAAVPPPAASAAASASAPAAAAPAPADATAPISPAPGRREPSAAPASASAAPPGSVAAPPGKSPTGPVSPAAGGGAAVVPGPRSAPPAWPVPRFEPIPGRPVGGSDPEPTAPAIPGQRPASHDTDAGRAGETSVDPSAAQGVAAEGVVPTGAASSAVDTGGAPAAAADRAEAGAVPAAAASAALAGGRANKAGPAENRGTEDGGTRARVSGDRAPADRASEDRAPEDRASKDRASGDQVFEGQATEDQVSEGQVSEGQVSEGHATKDRASEDRASEDADLASAHLQPTTKALEAAAAATETEAKAGTPARATPEPATGKPSTSTPATSTPEPEATTDPEHPRSADTETAKPPTNKEPTPTRAQASKPGDPVKPSPDPDTTSKPFGRTTASEETAVVAGPVASYSAASDGVRSEEFRIQESSTGEPWSEDAPTAVDAPLPILGDGGPVVPAGRARPVRGLATVVPGADPEQRRKRFIVIAVAVVVLIAAVVFMVTRGAEDGGAPRNQGASQGATGPGTTAAATPTAAATSDPAAPPPISNTPAPADQRPQLPAGWREHVDRTGFSVYVPAHWRESREGTMVYFRGDGRVLGIDQTDQPKPDPVADWTAQRNRRLANGDFPGYNEIRIAEVPYFTKAADWEFTYNNGGTHVSNRGVIVGPSRAYGFWWQTSGNDWVAAAPVLQIVYDSFRPDPSKVG